MSIDKAEFRKQLLNADGKPLWARDEGWERHDKLTGKHGQSLDSLSGEVKRGEVSTFGFHHIAYVCRNMKETINFYESALGMKCRAIYPMHGVPGAKHCFLDCGNGCELSFIEFSEPVEGIPGVSYPPKNNMPSPIGTHHHMAFRARSLTHLHNLRDQVRKQGLFASKVIHHGFICSFYFTDPSGFHLECTTTVRDYTDKEFQPNLLKEKVQMDNYVWDERESMKIAEEEYQKEKAKAKL